MATKKASRTRSDNDNFMDSAVLLAGSWPLLLGLPVLAGIVSFALVAAAPAQHRAISRIPLIEGAQALIDTVEFDERFATSGLAADNFILVADLELATRTTIITTTAANAEEAKTAVESTIAALRTLRPIQTSSLLQQEELLSTQIGRLEDFATSLEASLHTSTPDGVSALSIADAVVALTDSIRSKQGNLGAVRNQLEIARSIAALPPDIVVTPVAKDWRVVLATILAGATLAAALVYARLRLMQASKVPGFEEKRARIVRALTLNLFGGRTDNGSR